MVKVLDSSLEVSLFELQLIYNIYFRTNTVSKDMNHLIIPAMS